jgi:hypothetical protein
VLKLRRAYHNRGQRSCDAGYWRFNRDGLYRTLSFIRGTLVGATLYDHHGGRPSLFSIQVIAFIGSIISSHRSLSLSRSFIPAFSIGLGRLGTSVRRNPSERCSKASCGYIIVQLESTAKASRCLCRRRQTFVYTQDIADIAAAFPRLQRSRDGSDGHLTGSRSFAIWSSFRGAAIDDLGICIV